MDITLKVKEEIFNFIDSGERNFVKHGYSGNKKYMRLFENEINQIKIVAAQTMRECYRTFDGIVTIEENGKKLFKLTFK